MCAIHPEPPGGGDLFGRPHHANPAPRGSTWHENARLLSRHRLTPVPSDRQIWAYRIEVPEADGWGLQAGDSVELRLLSSRPLADAVAALLRSSPETRAAEASLRSATAQLPVLELRTPTKALIQCLADRTGDAALRQLTEDPAQLLATAQRVDVLELLRRHPQVLTLQDLQDLLPPVRPRAYSLAAVPHPGEPLELLVRTVRYERDGRVQVGTVSGALERLPAPGGNLYVRPRPAPLFHLPDPLGTDVLLIGSGVGIAPFHAFLQERRARRDPGRAWLIFGLRNREEDLLYRRDLQSWKRDGTLWRLDLAESRPETPPARHVQKVLLHAREQVRAFLRGGAHVYVCGGAHTVGLGVRDALIQVLDGEDALMELAAEGRHHEDVY
ncbi:MAG: hypothetical protein LKF88_01000 [Microbacteriaceae bacterium]|nr:hypothetical protein [Microbacteriaceae bacterium]MCI1207078.1 hypothetical protein [Microbacteriaceae bacterium]